MSRSDCKLQHQNSVRFITIYRKQLAATQLPVFIQTLTIYGCVFQVKISCPAAQVQFYSGRFKIRCMQGTLTPCCSQLRSRGDEPPTRAVFALSCTTEPHGALLCLHALQVQYEKIQPRKHVHIQTILTDATLSTQNPAARAGPTHLSWTIRA